MSWITVNGTHIPIDEEGVATGGPLKGHNFSNAKSTGKSNSSKSSGEKSSTAKSQSEKTTKVKKDPKIAKEAKKIDKLSTSWLNGKSDTEKQIKGISSSSEKNKIINGLLSNVGVGRKAPLTVG